MQSNSRDPLDWTVDEVVNFLCHNPDTPWSMSNSTAPRPPASFEASLRDNFITGEVLLQDVEKEALRDDLGLKALGHRSSIMMAIRYLQRFSPKFQASRSDRPAAIPPPSPMPPPTPLQPAAEYLSTVQQATPTHTKAVNVDVARQNSSSPAVPAQGLSGGLYQKSVDLGQEAIENVKRIRPRSHEQLVVDNHGNKKRRLNLTSTAKPTSDNAASVRPSDSELESWYMGPNGLTVEQIFYASDPEGDDQTFAFLSSKLPTAQRTFVNNRLKYYFQQSPIELSSNESSSEQALIPYKPSMLKSSKNKSFTLYNTKQGKTEVTKESMSDWPQLMRVLRIENDSESRSKSLGPSDPFSYLLQKYPAEEGPEHALPIYGDSGSEGEFDAETWQEMEEEQDEPMLPRHRRLGPAEIDSIIKDCITQFETKWRDSHQAKEEYKARKLWLATRRSNRVNQEVKSLTKDIALLELRLNKLQDEIGRNEYSIEAELRAQCQCLEQTIFNIQKQKWRTSVLEQEECPKKVPAPPKRRYSPKAKSGDEESLHSESDFSENDSLDDFVMVDTGPFESIQDPDENSPASPLSSEGDDDIISVSGTRRRTRGLAPKVFASSSPSPSLSTPRPRSFGGKPEVIDLTEETPEPDEFMIKTPPLNPAGATTSNFPDTGMSDSSMSPPPSLGSVEGSVQVKTESGSRPSLPDITDMDSIMSMDWRLLEERKDRLRLLAKLIGGLSDEERKTMAEQIPEYAFTKLKSKVQKALKALIKSKKEVEGMAISEGTLMLRTSSFFIAWLDCARCDVEGIKRKRVEAALEDLKLKKGGFDTYYEELIRRLECCRTWRYDTEVGTDQELETENTPHKKRKRVVQESQQAKANQASAKSRMKKQEQQKKRLEKEFQSKGIRNDNPDHQAVSFKEPPIYLHSHIGESVKPHQLGGIQFMWRELVENKKQEGCLLAHTMGLGKTMQVISLLVTITAAAMSPDPKVRQQVPKEFRPTEDLPQARTLIICPSSLIENWQDEFDLWMPRDIALTVRRISAENGMHERVREVSTWYTDGGVLLISYDIFRILVLNSGTAKRGPPLSEPVHQKVRNWLLEGPSIIIADEAHKIKNRNSKASQAALQLRSKSRIALTGSPLANHLGEYYTMVNWIAEGYLGEANEFKANYIEPIREGLYADSTYGEKRKSLMKLQVLKKILEPKINRADITVLEGDLPPKVEFVLTVPLTRIQEEAYNAYAAFLLQGRMEEVAQTTLWSWLAFLSMCCNHPACFREKLNRAQAASENAKSPSRTHDVDQERFSEELDEELLEVAKIPNLAEHVSEQRRRFDQIHDLMAVDLSVRAEITKRIIDESIRTGDKVLVFSHSVPTLNYLEYLMRISDHRYSRLDGQTPVAQRQAAIKEFNRGDKQVYLISTKAGGLGLNITGANRVIIFDFLFNPIWEEQAVGRAYRLGQTKPVFVYRFVAGGTYQEIVHDKTTFKTELSARVVDSKNVIRSSMKKPGDYFFPAKPVAQRDISEYIGKDKEVLDKILHEDEKKSAEQKLIRDIKLTQTFFIEDNDKLTEEEKKSVREALDDEILRRDDPNAYYKKIQERQLRVIQQQHQALPPYPHPFPLSIGQNLHQPQIPSNAPSDVPPATTIHHAVQQGLQPAVPPVAHNTGPPALAPDTISVSDSQGPNDKAQLDLPPGAAIPQPKAPPGAKVSAIANVREALRNATRPQIPTSRDGSEPLRQISPAVNAPRPDTGNQQGTSPKGQSVPLHLKESAPEASVPSEQGASSAE
ncbi:putative SNF2 family helicase/ATPase [Aspergillus mulundensis]|uniref:SNF2 family helicase/ATPase n=1 Tax=Aspergillus mulundensis TaxID=1810919 RepID=A0A3D8RXN0_9EURO|nr:hypothetical protein DSM5745_05608 [Aspergillus mulundensis]RDW78756.1 hypothetical protein DSM5745_05608 [Aspergillus mulundensis]